ncbi:U3 small nucleolar RNA-associated protein 14 [Kwoniella heveanensis BCC8398]|uniref:U3 small nucleolar RNA-associated protein 14 n=1 Tax=Kwoniella heveanensis BCC8398 TaxID=1296120 RepID=A0A1B9GKF9_9TREE|nr:U3 small nucleolar RNA-associated protein 14 [Kwoniella heveanensis BCC8398]
MARSGAGARPFSASTASTSKPTKSQGGSKAKRRQDPTNAYTYLPSLPKRHRTSAQQFTLSRDELESAGPSKRRGQNGGDDGDSDDDGDGQDMRARIRKVAMMIADDNPQEVESDESSIDSDEAWGSDGSDEERWGDVFRELDKGKGKKGKSKAKEVVRKPAKPLTVNLDESEDETVEPNTKAKGKKVAKAPTPSDDEDEDEVEDEEESELISDVGAEDEGVSLGAEESGDKVRDDDEEEDEDEDEDEEEEDEDSDLELPSDLSEDEDEADDDALAGLDAFVDQLASADKKKRKASAEDKSGEGIKKRRVLPVVAGPGLKENGDLALKNNQKLDLSSLISSHPSLSGASALLPAKSDKKLSTSILKQGLVSAPLPTVVQERLDREAAYEKTKEEGQKWGGVMKRVKEAEHLSFPLQPEQRGGVKSGNEVLAGFKPENKLESAVTALLNKANLTEDSMTKREDLALEAQEMTLEEIKERRAALRYQRELMFRAEAKAKRVAKIKSKTFRKLARKRAAKENPEVDLEDLERLDPEAAALEREKLERDRARERATLRHGAKSGRWAKDVGGDANEIEDRRKAKEEMLDIKERLQRKIMGREEGSDSETDDNEDEDEDDEEMIKSRAFDQLASLDGNAGAESGEQGGKKGLMQMAFMKKAQEREMKKVAEQEAELKRDIEMFGQDGEDGSDVGEEDSEDEERPSMMRVGGNEGRMVFSGPNSTTVEPAKPIRRSALSQSVRQPSPPSTAGAQSSFGAEHNPWLVQTSGGAGPSRKRNALVGSANAKAEEKVTRALKKAAKGREAELEDEKVEIAVDGPSLLPSGPSGQGQKKDNKKGKKVTLAVEAEYGSDEEDEDELMPVNGIKAFKQRDLVAEAFAGDNVVEDFAREKDRQIEADAPKVEDTSLPGWGSWGGKGTRKKAVNPKFLVKSAGIEPTQRKDFTRSNVIITEKKDKKASQFLVTDLPYPYTSKEQYEKSFATPVGSEWNSRAGYQRGTLPRVIKKPGAIIEPVRRMF